MAIKITTQIGTDRGITSEAYIRIADYQVSKYGSANFRLEIFLSEEDAVTPSSFGRFSAPSVNGGTAHNQQIGDNLYVTLTKTEERTHIVSRLVPIQVTTQVPGIPDEDGNPTTVDQITTEMQLQDVEETYTATVPDLSDLETGTIFEFGYSHLKTKLAELFGADHLVDC